MRYLVIEDFFPYPWIVTDEFGVPKEFDNIEEAEREAKDCQRGVVVKL